MRKELVTCALAVVLCACPKQKTDDTVKPAPSAAPASGPAAAAPAVAPTVAPTAGSQGALGLAGEGKMAHCPSSVEGATTEIKDLADGVEVTVTAKGEPQVADIRSRSKHLATVAVKDPVEVKHTGDGEGGGGRGHCPVVLQNTKIEVAEVEGGAKVTVKPVKPEDLEWLKKESRAREGRVADALKPAEGQPAAH